MWKFLFPIFSALLAPPCLAGNGNHMILGLAGTQKEEIVEQGSPKNSKTKDRVTIYDVMLGYQFDFGLIVGARYWSSEKNTNLSNESGVITSGEGLTLGYFHESGVYVNAGYLIDPSKDYDPAGTKNDTSYYGGYGVLFGVGYVKMLGQYGLGVNVEQSDVVYKKFKGGDGIEQSLSGTWKDHGMYPYLQLLVQI